MFAPQVRSSGLGLARRRLEMRCDAREVAKAKLFWTSQRGEAAFAQDRRRSIGLESEPAKRTAHRLAPLAEGALDGPPQGRFVHGHASWPAKDRHEHRIDVGDPPANR